MAQVFTSSADIGGANIPRANVSNAPFVTGYKLDSTSVTAGSTGAWPVPIFGGFVPQQGGASLFVSTSSGATGTVTGTFTYIPCTTAAMSSGAAPPLAARYGVAALVYDSQNNRLWAWNPVSSAWAATTTGAFTTTST